MATIEVVNYCNELLKKQGWRNVKTNEPTQVDLSFLGIDRKVRQSELMKMSKAEQERHIQQDILLLSVHTDSETKSISRLRAEIIASTNKTIISTELIAQGL